MILILIAEDYVRPILKWNGDDHILVSKAWNVILSIQVHIGVHIPYET